MGVLDVFAHAGFRSHGAPLKLHWAGWETDTARLQVAGWQLSAEQCPHRDMMRLAISHPRWDTRGLTPDLRFDYIEALRHPEYARQLPPFPISLANKLWIREKAIPGVSARYLEEAGDRREHWRPIDARPSIEMFDERSLEDVCHFKALAGDELVVPEEGVAELLERIVAMQSGARLERFREQVREERASKRLIVPHCQIISLREAA